MHAGVEKSGRITSVLVSMCQDIFFFKLLRKDFFFSPLVAAFTPQQQLISKLEADQSSNCNARSQLHFVESIGIFKCHYLRRHEFGYCGFSIHQCGRGVQENNCILRGLLVYIYFQKALFSL